MFVNDRKGTRTWQLSRERERMTKIANGAAVSRAVSGPALASFCWAAEPIAILVDHDPTLVTDLLRVRRVRMHLIALDR